MPFMHLRDFSQHIRAVHAHKKFFQCTLCNQKLAKRDGNQVDLKHFSAHDFSLCHCPYCTHQTDTTDLMQDHLRDKHPTRYSYALIRVLSDRKPKSNEVAAINQKLATIIVFDLQQVMFGVPELSEAQINFMDPTLDSARNLRDPPAELGERSATFLSKRAHFITLYRMEAAKEDRLKIEHGICKASDVLKTADIKRVSECSTGNAQPASQLTLNGSPIVRLAVSGLNAAAAISNSSSSSSSTTKGNAGVERSFSVLMQSEIDISAKVIIESGGNVDTDELFHCAFPECDWVKSSEFEFLAHLSQHIHSGYYECYHCKKCFKMAVELKNHIKTHQKCRFFCFYCECMCLTPEEMCKHFDDIHGCKLTSILPLNTSNVDIATDLFVVCPPGANIQEFYKRIMTCASILKAEQRKFLPSQVDSLPKNQIFQLELECAVCGFGTKVRQNLIRHFTFEGCSKQQAQAAPINPVNDTGERHFDQMRNLAASSNEDPSMATATATEHGSSKFVPESERYRCFATSCAYQNLSSDLLQKHIETLHATADIAFSCPHCREDLNACNTAKEMLDHLRYHESRIYKCPSCAFVHYLKQHVDKHISETHPNVRERAITLDRPAKKDDSIKGKPPKSGSTQWNCNVCSAQFDTQPQVKLHLQNEHRLSGQYKCSICQYSHNFKSAIKDHLNKDHGEDDINKIKDNYVRIVVDVDNRPLWRRDDPSRVSFDDFSS